MGIVYIIFVVGVSYACAWYVCTRFFRRWNNWEDIFELGRSRYEDSDIFVLTFIFSVLLYFILRVLLSALRVDVSL